MTGEEIDEINRKVRAYEAKLIKELEATKKYKRDYGREPCCAKNALEGSCLCWQDSWC
jgi:hypothetical protein